MYITVSKGDESGSKIYVFFYELSDKSRQNTEDLIKDSIIINYQLTWYIKAYNKSRKQSLIELIYHRSDWNFVIYSD